LDDLNSYQVHPEHKKVAAYIGKVKTSRAAVDYEVLVFFRFCLFNTVSYVERFFYFSKGQRTGILILIALILITVVLNVFTSLFLYRQRT